MGAVIFVLLRYLPVEDHKLIAINGGNMSVRPAENLKRSINDFIGRYDVMIVAQYIMQIDASPGVAPYQCSQKIPDVVDLLFHHSHGCPVEVLIKGREINIGREYRLHCEHVVK